MKNSYLIPVLISGALLVTSNGIAAEKRVISFEVGLELWDENTKGTFQNNGTVIDFKDRGFKSSLNPSAYLNIKTTGKKPNLKLRYSKIKNSKKGPLGSDLTLNGLNYFTNQDLKLGYNADIFDLILESDVVKKKEIFNKSTIFDLDLGVGARYIDGDLSITQCAQNTETAFTQLVPIVYARSELHSKSNSKTKLITQLVYSPSKTQHLDAKLGVTHNFTKTSKWEIGYRYNQTKNIDGHKVNAKTRGLYLGFAKKF